MACRQEYGRRGCSSKTLNVRSTVIVGLAVVIELAVRGLLRNIRPCGVWAMICDALLLSLWVAIGGLERSSEMKCISMLELGWVCISPSLKMPLHQLSLICAGSSTNSLHQSPDALIEGDTTHILQNLEYASGARAYQGHSFSILWPEAKHYCSKADAL